jgi:phosphoribosylformylglycinamidine synthase
MTEEISTHNAVKALLKANLINAAHDLSEGGLFVTLLESAIAGNKGFNIESDPNTRKDAFLFGEAQSRVVVTVPASREDTFIKVMMKQDAEFSMLGVVKGMQIIIDEEKWGTINHWKGLYDHALENALNG